MRPKKRIMRTMRTTNERRAYVSAIEQGVRIRPRRNLANVRTAWDDYFTGRPAGSKRNKTVRGIRLIFVYE